ncbi:MAG TPA: 3-hydroxyacyl-CoA dehydrogenase NAD-binding domain-containing protein, partial [Acidothermaceae bacterium]|nr:3-hydroxyacyl-CoA dehydrogenase NAD-binding domain-containing protein [Acidothermaceae bacterium]
MPVSLSSCPRSGPTSSANPIPMPRRLAADMKRIAVVGAGLMGSGIAQVAAHAGYDVVLHDTTSDALERALSGIASSQERFVAKGKM